MLVHVNTTVGNTPTLILTLPTTANYTAVQINNRDSQNVYIGDINITSAVGANGGTSVALGGSIQIWLSGGDKLYGVSAAGTAAGAVSCLYSYIPVDVPTN